MRHNRRAGWFARRSRCDATCRSWLAQCSASRVASRQRREASPHEPPCRRPYMRSLLSSIIRGRTVGHSAVGGLAALSHPRILSAQPYIRSGFNYPVPQSCLRRRRRPGERDHSCTTRPPSAMPTIGHTPPPSAQQHSTAVPVLVRPGGQPLVHQTSLDLESPECDQELTR